MEVLHLNSPYEKAAILYSGAIEHAMAFKDAVQELLPDGETWIEIINPVLGAHIGPGVLGFACVSKGLAGKSSAET